MHSWKALMAITTHVWKCSTLITGRCFPKNLYDENVIVTGFRRIAKIFALGCTWLRNFGVRKISWSLSWTYLPQCWLLNMVVGEPSPKITGWRISDVLKFTLEYKRAVMIMPFGTLFNVFD